MSQVYYQQQQQPPVSGDSYEPLRQLIAQQLYQTSDRPLIQNVISIFNREVNNGGMNNFINQFIGNVNGQSILDPTIFIDKWLRPILEQLKTQMISDVSRHAGIPMQVQQGYQQPQVAMGGYQQPPLGIPMGQPQPMFQQQQQYPSNNTQNYANAINSLNAQQGNVPSLRGIPGLTNNQEEIRSRFVTAQAAHSQLLNQQLQNEARILQQSNQQPPQQNNNVTAAPRTIALFKEQVVQFLNYTVKEDVLGLETWKMERTVDFKNDLSELTSKQLPENVISLTAADRCYFVKDSENNEDAINIHLSTSVPLINKKDAFGFVHNAFDKIEALQPSTAITIFHYPQLLVKKHTSNKVLGCEMLSSLRSLLPENNASAIPSNITDCIELTKSIVAKLNEFSNPTFRGYFSKLLRTDINESMRFTCVHSDNIFDILAIKNIAAFEGLATALSRLEIPNPELKAKVQNNTAVYIDALINSVVSSLYNILYPRKKWKMCDVANDMSLFAIAKHPDIDPFVCDTVIQDPTFMQKLNEPTDDVDTPDVKSMLSDSYFMHCRNKTMLVVKYLPFEADPKNYATVIDGKTKLLPTILYNVLNSLPNGNIIDLVMDVENTPQYWKVGKTIDNKLLCISQK